MAAWVATKSARVVGLGLACWAAVEIAGVVFKKTAMATLLVQAVIAEWGAGYIGIEWTADPARGPAAPRAARGAAIGGAAAVVSVVLSLAAGLATRWPASPSPWMLVLGLATASLGAVRDELLLRGVPLRATRGVLPSWAGLLAAGATAAASVFGAAGAPVVMLGEGLRGIALGGLWLADGGAWMACAANAAWMWTFGAATRGGLLDVRFGADPRGSPASLGVLACAAGLSLWLSSRSSRRQPDAA